MNKWAIIVAGGLGSRMNSSTPKQFLNLCGKPLLMYTISAFYKFSKSVKIIVVLPKEQIVKWQELCAHFDFCLPYEFTAGGKSRSESTKAGLALVKGDGIIAVHDGARCNVSPELIKKCFSAAQEFGSAVPFIPLKDSIRLLTETGNKHVKRDEYVLIQTPQCFRSDVLKEAFNQKNIEHFSDEASCVEQSGVTIHLVEGEHDNIKVTTPTDLAIASSLMNIIL